MVFAYTCIGCTGGTVAGALFPERVRPLYDGYLFRFLSAFHGCWKNVVLIHKEKPKAIQSRDISLEKHAPLNFILILKPADPQSGKKIGVKDTNNKDTPDPRKELVKVLDSGKGSKVNVQRLKFEEGSPLHDYEVFRLTASLKVMQQHAQELGMVKKLKPIVVNEVSKKASYKSGTKDVYRPFKVASAKLFDGAADDPETFFTPSEHIILINELLYCATSGTRSSLLMAQLAGEVDAVLALHDADDLEEIEKKWNPLALRLPPSEDIAAYFGPNVALYFSFLHEYLLFLFCPAFLGVLAAFCHEVMTQMYPASVAPFSHTLLSPMYLSAVLIVSTLFLAHWRREVALVRYRLGRNVSVVDPRPIATNAEYGYFFSRVGRNAQKDATRLILQKPSQDFDAESENKYLFTAMYAVVVCSMTLLVAHVLNFVSDTVRGDGGMFTQVLPSILYICVVSGLDPIYACMAEWVTHTEAHVVYTDFVRSLTMKKAAYQILNNLGWFLYLAFWRQDVNYLRSQLFIFFTFRQVLGNVFEVFGPMQLSKWRKKRAEMKRLMISEGKPGAAPAPATPELAAKPAAAAPTAAASTNTTAASAPAAQTTSTIKTIFGSAGKKEPYVDIELMQAVEDQWSREDEVVADEYSELAVMFAAAVWFAPVFPMGAILALAHVVGEYFSDRYKICTVTRRNFPRGADFLVLDCWLKVFDLIGWMGIILPVFLVGVANRDSGGWSAIHVILFEHAFIFFKGYVTHHIPAEPEWLTRHMHWAESSKPEAAS